MLWAAAAATLCLSAVVYFRGRFHAAAIFAVAFWSALSVLFVRSFGPVAAALSIAFFVALPAAMLAIHAVDARRGVFLWPTIYAIPLGYVAGLLGLVCAVVALI